MFNVQLKNQILDDYTDKLDISDSDKERLEQTYERVADWLKKGDELSKLDIHIFSQGSVGLGTVIKPVGRDDYDVDAVCKFDKKDICLGAEKLKQLVGDRLKENKSLDYHLDEEGKRCWTLIYKDYHIDVLPSVATNDDYILATNKDEDDVYTYVRTNPEGYKKWFLSVANRYNRMLLDSAKIDKLPEYIHKTPLQKAVQLLKQHRNVMFKGDKDKPISIIITTLCAMTYEKGSNIFEALEEFITGYGKYITSNQNGYLIENPTVHGENFAEKWNSNPEKKDAFDKWIELFKEDFVKLMNSVSIDDFLKTGERMFGSSFIQSAKETLNIREYINSPKSISQSVSYLTKEPFSCCQQTINFSLQVTVKGSRGLTDEIYRQGTPKISKNRDLEFVTMGAPRGKTYWQVVNTGKEAFDAYGLRGEWHEDNDSIHTESTLYSGKHFIRCAVVNNNQCVGMSNWLEINIGE